MDAPPRGYLRSFEERYAAHAAAPNENGCRLWTASLNPRGYGIMTDGKNRGRMTIHAHRRTYEHFSGEELTARDAVHHKCGVSACVEYTHLQKITPAENSAEMLERVWYKKRIAQLEIALASFNPDHELLNP